MLQNKGQHIFVLIIKHEFFKLNEISSWYLSEDDIIKISTEMLVIGKIDHEVRF